MGKRTIGLIAVLMCAWVSSFGQSSGLPQWKVVKEFHVTGQTAAIPPTVIFTAPDNGLYRFSEYLAASPSKQVVAGWQAELNFTDRRGDASGFGVQINLELLPLWQTVNPSVFSPKQGTNVIFELDAFGQLPPDATYDAEFCIERLTR